MYELNKKRGYVVLLVGSNSVSNVVHIVSLWFTGSMQTFLSARLRIKFSYWLELTLFPYPLCYLPGPDTTFWRSE